MTITIAELKSFKNSMTFLAQLRAMPVEIIEFYMENECGYIIRKAEDDPEKTVMIQPPPAPSSQE
jgi:hypothetical protein